jgi:acyl-CoA thioester hydrolase
MARVTIDLPEKFDLSTEFEVYMADVNAGGHLGNQSLVSLLNEAHLRLMKAKGFPDLVVDGLVTINKDLSVIYKSEVFYGDVLVFEVAVAGFHKYGFDLVHRVTSKSSSKVAAVARVGMLFFDLNSRKVAEVPQRFKQACGL